MKVLVKQSEQVSRPVFLLWLALLVAIPVTSFPLVEQTIGGETVSPLSVLPLLALVVLWVIPYLIRGGKLPSEAGPLLAFAAVAVLSSALALLLPLGPYKGQTVADRTLRGLGTLGIGVSFYLAASLLSSDERKLMTSLRAIYAGALLTLVWGSLQAWFVLQEVESMPWMLNQVHRLISVRDLLPDRVTGTTYEPSWFGNLMVVLYMPIWLGALLRGRSAISTRRAGLAVELVLLLWGMFLLFLARSRLSVVSLSVLVLVSIVYGLWKGAAVLIRALRLSPGGWLASRLARLVAVALSLAVLITGIVGLLRLALRSDPRFDRLSLLPAQLAGIRREHPFEVEYAVAARLAFAERLVYWAAGVEPYERYPVLGVGLGNAGFLFEQGLPDFGHSLTEIRETLDPANANFPNPKNLWIRLLSETGLVGLAAFLTWMLVLGTASAALSSRGRGLTAAVGMAGLLSLLAQPVEGFSLDSFALPQFWIVMGLVTAQAWRMRPNTGSSPP